MIVITTNIWRMTMTRGKPKKDGSGKGRRLNKGRGGCKDTKNEGGKTSSRKI